VKVTEIAAQLAHCSALIQRAIYLHRALAQLDNTRYYYYGPSFITLAGDAMY
jgi:hypothetical protein